MLSDDQVRSFVDDGCVAVADAFSREVAERCLDIMWPATGCDRDDPTTWTRPVVRLDGFGDPPFVEAANTPALTEAFDQLVGPGRWLPRTGLGTIPVRFASDQEPGDDGWHVEGSYVDTEGEMRVDLPSRGRALLMLFLFTDVGEDDAPTRVRLGSHLDVPPVLETYGEAGGAWMEVCQRVVPATVHRPSALATGAAGTVWLCHPFLVHAAQPHRGSRPRFMAQPPLVPRAPWDLDGAEPSPVEQAVLRGLGR